MNFWLNLFAFIFHFNVLIALGTLDDLEGLWMLDENASEDTLDCCVILEEGDWKEPFCETKKYF